MKMRKLSSLQIELFTKGILVMLIKGLLAGITITLSLGLSSCGSSNFNQIFKVSGEDKRLDSLLALGRISFDRGEYDKALDVAKEAYAANPNSEEAAVLLGYAYLGSVGSDPFGMVRNIIEAQEGEGGAKLATSNDTSDVLSSFSSVIALSDDDVQEMLDAKAGVSTNPFFVGKDVYIPKLASEARANVSMVNSVSKAITAICPFVSESSKIDGYALHNCESANIDSKIQAKSDFLWALAHLAEGLAFNAALFYSPGTALMQGATSNTPIAARVAALQGTVNPSQVADYISAVDELKDNITDIFNTSEDGMLYSLLADLSAVSKGFGSIAGMSGDVSDSIDSALGKVKTQSESYSGEDSELGSQSEALKNQFNENINNKLKTSITTFNNDGSHTAEDKAKLCESYKEITDYASNPGVQLPTGC